MFVWNNTVLDISILTCVENPLVEVSYNQLTEPLFAMHCCVVSVTRVELC